MNTSRSSTLLHGEAFRLLPWYVKGLLEPERLRQVDLHLEGCLACRREAEGLTQLFCVHAQITKPRPIDEGRLQSLFARIDRYEAARRRPPRAGSARSALMRWRERILEWLDTRFMLVGSASAAALLAAVVGPMMLSSSVETRQQVLSSPEAAAGVRVKLRFRSTVQLPEVERLVASTLTERRVSSAYRVEQRSGSEYTVIFEQKPDLAALSGLLASWRAAPSIADAGIDDAAARR